MRASGDRHMRSASGNDGGPIHGPATVDAQDLAEMGDCYMLRDIQAQDTPEDTEAKKPEVNRNASHEAQHGRHGYLQSSSLHAPYYGLAGDRRKDHVQGPDENAGGRNGTCFNRPGATSPAPQSARSHLHRTTHQCLLAKAGITV
jgi:hypothetical protein